MREAEETADAFGITGLAVGDSLEVQYESPRATTTQTRRGRVSEIGEVDDEYGPTGTTEIVVSRREGYDLILWPDWNEARSSTSGSLGDIESVTRTNVADAQQRFQTDGGTVQDDFDLPAGVHDTLLGYQRDDERLEETLERVFALVPHSKTLRDAGVDPEAFDQETRVIVERWPDEDGYVGPWVYPSKTAFLKAHGATVEPPETGSEDVEDGGSR